MTDSAFDDDQVQTAINLHAGTGPGTNNPEEDLPPSDAEELDPSEETE